MDFGLQGQWALVCAASKGLGLGCAQALAAEGVNLVINARGDAALQAAAAALRSAGVRTLYDTAKRGTAGSLVNFCHPKDCGGVLVELVQAAPDPHH